MHEKHCHFGTFFKNLKSALLFCFSLLLVLQTLKESFLLEAALFNADVRLSG